MLPVISKWSKIWLDPLRLYVEEEKEEWEEEREAEEEVDLFGGKYKFTTGLSEFIELPFDVMYPGSLRPTLELSEQQMSEIKKVFDDNIVNGLGYNTFNDLQVALRGLGYEPPPRLLRQRIKNMGGDPWKPLPFYVFFTILATKMCRRSEIIEIYKSFRLLDRGKKRHLTFGDFEALAHEFGIVLNDDEIRDLWDISDHDGDGVVTKEDFVRIMKLSGIYTTYYFKG